MIKTLYKKIYNLLSKKFIIYINRMQKYQIMSAIGEGAYGVVLKCRDVQNDINVAIKKFKDSDDE